MTGVRRYRAPSDMPLAEPVGRRIKHPIYFDEDLYHQLRRRAEQDQSTVGEVVIEIVRRRFGG